MATMATVIAARAWRRAFPTLNPVRRAKKAARDRLQGTGSVCLLPVGAAKSAPSVLVSSAGTE